MYVGLGGHVYRYIGAGDGVGGGRRQKSLVFWLSFCPAYLLSLDGFVSITCLPKTILKKLLYTCMFMKEI